MKLFSFNHETKPKEYIVVVSGLPRSGTSMMMKMLEAGGLLPVTDHIRTADADNPKGYYEFERVKKLPDGDTGWLKDAPGKAVKVISALLEHLPSEYQYKVIFMRRKLEEVLASQKQMLINENKPVEKEVSDELLAEIYQKHLAKIDAWLRSQPNIEVLYTDYNALVKEPTDNVVQINAFLDNRLDPEKMVQAVDPQLYRQRKEEQK